jgi:hypothetical protein
VWDPLTLTRLSSNRNAAYYPAVECDKEPLLVEHEKQLWIVGVTHTEGALCATMLADTSRQIIATDCGGLSRYNLLTGVWNESSGSVIFFRTIDEQGHLYQWDLLTN